MSEEGLELFVEVPQAKGPRYAQALRFYAEILWPGKDPESGVRTLKRWVKKGKASGDAPPFDDLPGIATWYERHHRYAVAPEELRRFEVQVGEKVEEEDAPAEMPVMTLNLDGDHTADEGLRQCRALVQATYEQMEVALKQRQTKAYQSLRREWQSLINTQRQWEKDILKIQEGKGEVLRTRVINSELVRIFTASAQSFFNATLKTLQDHAPHLPGDEQRRIALEKRDEVFTHLRGTRFDSAWIPGNN